MLVDSLTFVYDKFCEKSAYIKKIWQIKKDKKTISSFTFL